VTDEAFALTSEAWSKGAATGSSVS